ncbi:hypothetical protein ScPMuIL_001545 [Solemya velum]
MIQGPTVLRSFDSDMFLIYRPKGMMEIPPSSKLSCNILLFIFRGRACYYFPAVFVKDGMTNLECKKGDRILSVSGRPRTFEEGDIRLIGGRRANVGTVLIYRDGKWGAVCDHKWDLRDASVVCRQLGYSGVERASLKSEFGRGRRHKWLSHVSCRGNEVKLEQCGSSEYFGNNCRGAFHSAGVECTSTTTTQKSTTRTTRRPTLLTSTTSLFPTTTEHATAKPPTTDSETSTATSDHIATTLKPQIVAHEARTSQSPITPSSWVWHEDSNTWFWNSTYDDTENQDLVIQTDDVVVDHNDDDNNDGDPYIFDTFLNDEAAITSDHDLAEYVAPSVSISGGPRSEIHESDGSESSYSDNYISLDLGSSNSDDILTSPKPTTQTPWMWDDTLLQYILRPQNGRRTESPWIWDHENEKYVLRSEYEQRVAEYLPPHQANSAGSNQRLIGDRQHDSAHVREPLEIMASDIQGNNQPRILSHQVPSAESENSVYDVPFIPEAANPDEYLSGTSMVAATNEGREHESHHHQNRPNDETAPTVPFEHNGDHSQQINDEHSSNGYDNMPTHILLPTENVMSQRPLPPTIESSNNHATGRIIDQQPTISEDLHAQKIEYMVRGGRNFQEGHIEVRIPYGDRRGVICGDMWTIKEAIVACRELGLGYAQSAATTAHYGGSDKDKLFWRVECTGSERKLEECVWKDHNGPTKCSRKDSVAGIVCTNALPDLIPNVTALETSSFLQDRHLYYLQCSMEENCLSSSAYEIMKTPRWRTTTRRLLRFSSIIHNRGTADFVPFVPRHLWEWHACHMHYHSMEVFARYDVVDEHGNKVAEGLKASFCLEDSACDYGVHPKYNCDGYGHQGIAVGCSDNYLADIDCQWIDMTDVKPGTYTFTLEVNPELKVAEMNFENNVVKCTLWYGGYSAQLQGCRLESLL